MTCALKHTRTVITIYIQNMAITGAGLEVRRVKQHTSIQDTT